MAKAKAVVLTVQGQPDSQGDDAPSVSTLLQQVQDFAKFFKVVETEVSTETDQQIDWRVTATSMKSPFTIHIAPYVRLRGEEPVRDLARYTVEVAATSLHGIATGTAKSLPDLPQEAILCLERMCYRVTKNLLIKWTIDFSEFELEHPNIDVHIFNVNSTNSTTLASKLRSIRKQKSLESTSPGEIVGEIVGTYFSKRGDSILRVRTRDSARIVRCRIDHDLPLGDFGKSTISNLQRGAQVSVYGLIRRDSHGKITDVEVDQINLR